MSDSNEQGPAATGSSAGYDATEPITDSDDRIRQFEKRAERAEAESAELRERLLAAKTEVDDLLGALVAASEELRKLHRLSPRRFITAKRIDRAIDRHRHRRLSVFG